MPTSPLWKMERPQGKRSGFYAMPKPRLSSSKFSRYFRIGRHLRLKQSDLLRFLWIGLAHRRIGILHRGRWFFDRRRHRLRRLAEKRRCERKHFKSRFEIHATQMRNAVQGKPPLFPQRTNSKISASVDRLTSPRRVLHPRRKSLPNVALPNWPADVLEKQKHHAAPKRGAMNFPD